MQSLQDLTGAYEAADPVESGGHVRTVVDRFVDVGEIDVGEPGGPQDLSYGLRVGERKRIPSLQRSRWRVFGCLEGLADCDVPFVAIAGLPDHHHPARGQAQRRRYVGERG